MFVAYGTPSRIVKAAIENLKAEGIKACLFRPKTLYPFPYKALKEAAHGKKFVLCAELSMGQMIQDVRIGLEGSVPVHFYGRAGGMVFEPKELVNAVKDHLGGR
jgi:2-oxoglutarate ferredoxin oxidoreductase subunit alpha